MHYPYSFPTCTCRICGGTIGTYDESLHIAEYDYELQWEEWKNKYNAAPPRPLKDEHWLKMCGFFNSCAICGSDINEKLLVIPPYLGGKLYSYNVLPACSTCAKRIRQSQLLNPIKSFYTVSGSIKSRVDIAFRYLEAEMLNVSLEFFNFEEDSIEIVVKCSEDTSILPFNGIYARRVFKPTNIIVNKKQDIMLADNIDNIYGITWRLLDE